MEGETPRILRRSRMINLISSKHMIELNHEMLQRVVQMHSQQVCSALSDITGLSVDIIRAAAPSMSDVAITKVLIDCSGIREAESEQFNHRVAFVLRLIYNLFRQGHLTFAVKSSTPPPHRCDYILYRQWLG